MSPEGERRPLGRLTEEVDTAIATPAFYHDDDTQPSSHPPATGYYVFDGNRDINVPMFYSADVNWMLQNSRGEGFNRLNEFDNRLTFSTSEVEPYLSQSYRADMFARPPPGYRAAGTERKSQEMMRENIRTSDTTVIDDDLLQRMYESLCGANGNFPLSLASALHASNSFLAEDELTAHGSRTTGTSNASLPNASVSSHEGTRRGELPFVPEEVFAPDVIEQQPPPPPSQAFHKNTLKAPAPTIKGSQSPCHTPGDVSNRSRGRKSKALNLVAKELTQTLLGKDEFNKESPPTEASTTSSSPCSRMETSHDSPPAGGLPFRLDNFPAASCIQTESSGLTVTEPGAPDEVVSEAIQQLRHAVSSPELDWGLIYDSLAQLVRWLGDRTPQRTLQVAMLAEILSRSTDLNSAPLTYDINYFCRGFAALWHVWTLVQSGAPLSPELMAGPAEHLSPGAQAVRTIIYSAQRLCLSALSTNSEMHHSDRKMCRQVALAGLSRLAWHAHECLEALAPIFFEVEGCPERDDFCRYIIHWNATGVLQRVFEVFTLALAKRGKWRALLWLLCFTRDLTHQLIDPALATKERFVSPVLPEAGILKACRPDVLRGMRFPVVALIALVHHLCDHLTETVEWPFITSPCHVVQSVLPLVLCKRYCEETCVSHPWHAEVFLEADNRLVNPSSILQIIESGSLLKQDADLLVLTNSIFPNEKGTSPLGIEREVVLDEIISSFIFRGDPKLGPMYESVVRESSDACYWLRGLESHFQQRVLALYGKLNEGTKSQERFYALLELCSRLVESFWLEAHRTPAAELLELCEESVSVMNLEAARRTIALLTGCQLGRIEVYLLKILEAYETAYGTPSDLPGLVGPSRLFNRTLLLTPFALDCLLSPIINFRLPSSSCLCLNLKLAPLKEAPSDSQSITSSSMGSDLDKDAFIYPTLLPVHVARLVPAWFSTRGNIAALFADDNRQYVGWRTLCMECLCASVADFRSRTPPTRTVAPHLDDAETLAFLKLYVEVANPRALHLLTRWIGSTRDRKIRIDELQSMLRSAESAKFSLFADSLVNIMDFSDTEEVSVLAPRLLSVYIGAGDGGRARILLKKLAATPVGSSLEAAWSSQIETLIVVGAKSQTEQEAKVTAQSRSVRWHKAVQAVKGFSTVNSVESSIAFFKDLRQGPGGIPDISIANKIIHICVANNKLTEAETLFRCLRQDAHGEQQTSQYAVKPDIITCNILLKGLAKKKPPLVDEIEQFITQMETPFHQGGDGVVADQVTFNTAINAAISAGSFEKAWEFLTTMKRRGIKVDGYTCSILMKQVGPGSRPEVVSEILRLLGELDLVQDPVLLSSVVDVCSRLRDFSRLRMTLEKYEAEVADPTPYAIATLVKGYGRCGMVHRASSWWDRLEQMPNVEWSQYIFGSAVDCFVTNGNLDKALAVFHKATKLGALLSDSQTTMLIRACTQRRRLQDALKLYRQMREHHLHLCDVTCNNLMHMCVTAGDLDTAMQILQDMSQNPMHQPDVVTYSTIIKGLCDCGAMTTAMQMFEDLPSKGLKPDIVTYNTLLEGYAKAEDAVQIEELFNQLLANNVKPTCYTLTILIKFYGRRHRLDKALQLIETLPKLYGIRMDAFVYTATIAACTWNGRVDKAIGFLQAMRQSFGASARTYGTLVAGCVKQQTWESLSIVLDCATEDKITLGKRDTTSLQELAQNWSQCTLNQKWLSTGFNEEAVAKIQKFLAAQQQTRQQANGANLVRR